ncbi:type II toxin-antitoxin system VapC family toxin [Hymenobacter actinosclerus]|uniref:Ribonuclease VapC n=1 Tax=Hymenobacter actinosclerus TaxID=82805 RepID=A0A1I0A2X3_9BACT|nr:type II toxin-antitoxin system VapC family toxin [Hymenobacter actinosclerus]SES88491.1 tRNA(fMet)-specific endonuclease VapC [Hymenobacter actinosclerus]
MKPILLDTDVLSHYLNNESTTVLYAEKYIQEFRQLSISIITHYEVLNGLYYRDARRRLIVFEKFTALHQILPLTLESVEISARIFADLRQTGRPIGHTDTLIAGVAMANGMQLATNNTAHFERIEGLELVNWTK